MSALVEVTDLRVDFHSLQGLVSAVRGVSFEVRSGEAVAVVGESGSGKSVTGRALLGLLDSNAEVSGSIRFDGAEIVGAAESELRRMRGVGIGMIFQDSLDSLNPVYTVGAQLGEVLRVRRGLRRREAKAESVRLLESVGITRPAERLRAYPHQFSGGMRQRVCIALAIALTPRLLVADEPTTALDVTVQASILSLMSRLQAESDMGLVFVTHDLAVARSIATRIIVMHDGEIVEQGAIDEVFAAPQHPYTRALFAAHPARATTWRDLTPIDDDELARPPRESPVGLGEGEEEAMIHGAG